MKTPPNMLSTKDTAYISDILSTLFVIYKKLDDEKQTIEDAEVKTMFEQATTLVGQQFETLLGLLK